MSNQDKSRYQKTHDTLEKHLNPEGYTIGDVIFRRVKWMGILMVIGLIYSFFHGKSDKEVTNKESASETLVVPRFEKKEYDPNYTDKIVSNLQAQLPIQSISKKLKVTSISHANHQINLDVVLQGANPSQNMQVMKYYCGTSMFKPLIEQNLDTYIKVMNENNSVAFETEIQGMADCP